MTAKIKRGWHFMPRDMKLGYGDNRKPKVGEWVKFNSNGIDAPEVCVRGMHMCTTLPRVIEWCGRGSQLCYVEVRGNMHVTPSKTAAEERRILWHINTTKLYKEFLMWLSKRPNSWFKTRWSLRSPKGCKDYYLSCSRENNNYILSRSVRSVLEGRGWHYLNRKVIKDVRKKFEELVWKYAHEQWEGVEK